MSVEEHWYPVPINEEAVTRLQREIDAHIDAYSYVGIERIVLDKGSEVTDLKSNASLRIFVAPAGRMRLFTVITADCVSHFVAPGRSPVGPRPDMDGIYTTGGPLAIVREITGSSIVRAVAWYLEMESGVD